MNLMGLRYFIAVHEYRNFTKASEHLFVSQPTLSRQIADLEEEMGVQLFDRRNREIVLTHAGEVFYREAKKIIAQCDQLPEMVRAANSEQKGYLRIGYMGTVERDLIAESIYRFSQKFPDINVSLSKDMLKVLNEFLIEDKVDVIYSVLPGVSTIRNLKYKKVADNKLKVIVPANHRLADRKSVSIAELEEEHFVMFERDVSPLTVDRTLAMCVDHGFSPGVTYYVKEPQSMIYSVAMGKGVAFLSERMQLTDVSGVRFLDLEDETPDFSIVIAYKKENENPYVKQFVDIAVDHSC